MNLYLRHIGDFNNATRHLTRVERSVYSDAIELYYDTEQALQCADIGKLERRLLCGTDDEKQALKDVLAEFFVLTDAGYTHSRCDAEIAKYRANTSAKARAGIASAAARKQNSTPAQQNSTPVEHTSTNRKPLTVNQEPIGETPPTAAKRASRKCPVDFLITDDMRTWAALECPGVDVSKATAKFSDHTFKTAMTDWPATWRNWLRSDQERAAKSAVLPAWREQQRSETQKAVPRIALGAVNPNTFFTELGASNVTALKLG